MQSHHRAHPWHQMTGSPVCFRQSIMKTFGALTVFAVLNLCRALRGSPVGCGGDRALVMPCNT
jgi:hypothetical protein